MDFLKIIKGLFDNISVVMIIIIALLMLIIDGNKYKGKNNKREYNIVRFISYSYIAFGIIIFILLMID